MQVIPLTMKMQERMLHVAGDVGMAQRTTPHSGIQPGLDLLASGNVSALVGKRGEFVLKLIQLLAGKAVAQSVGD